MKTKEKKRGRLFLINFIIFYIFSSCLPPSESEKPVEKLDPPGNVSASMKDEFNIVNWSSIPDAVHYKIYRKIDNADWIAISSLVENTRFRDYCPEYESDIIYAVKSENNGKYSDLSPPSNMIPRCEDDGIPLPPEEFHASRIGEHVFLYWTRVPYVSGYCIYEKIGNANWSKIKRISNNQEISWIDQDVPYNIDITYGLKTYWNKRYSEMITVTLSDSINIYSPVVDSFCKTGAIYIKWDIDPRADSYNLLRDVSPAGEFNEVVYSGEDLNYTDPDIIYYQFYYYRLELIKNGISAGISDEYSFGMGADTIKDNNENNNSLETATILNTGNNYENIYYFEDAHGNILQDEDWYYVFIPSLMAILIRIDQFENIESGSDIIYTQLDGESYILNEGDEFLLFNSEDQEQEIYFKISINHDSFSNKMGNYRIVVE